MTDQSVDVPVVRLANASDPVDLASLGVVGPAPVVAVCGSTTAIEGGLATTLTQQLTRLCQFAASTGTVLVTGGSDAGVFHLLGMALASTAEQPKCLGVAPERHVAVEPDPTNEVFALASGHTGFVLVPGGWGDETPVISRVVAMIAGPLPSVMLLAGGGAGAQAELVEHLRSRRPIVVIAGSGRLADQVVAATRGEVAPGLEALPPDVVSLLSAGDVSVISSDSDGDDLVHRLRSLLVPAERRSLRQRIPALSVLPRRHAAPPTAYLLDPRASIEHPRFAATIAELDRVLLPAFAALDGEANREQNRHRWFAVLAIVGGLLTTMMGAAQTWLHDSAWPGVLVAALGAGTSAVTTMARRQGSLQTWLDARVRAERLRSAYFERLVTSTAEPDGGGSIAALEREVTEIVYGTMNR